MSSTHECKSPFLPPTANNCYKCNCIPVTVSKLASLNFGITVLLIVCLLHTHKVVKVTTMVGVCLCYWLLAFPWICREAQRRATQLGVGLYKFQYEISVLDLFGEEKDAFV